ncbi:MAG: hypothetical protein ACREJB_03080 [Planctomycetaceae bacterium]
MSNHVSTADTLGQRIVEAVDGLITEAERSGKPLELDPYRGRLFELFVTADGAGLVDDEAEPDLSADGICRALAERWGLAEAARAALSDQTRLPPQQLAKMRMLWSMMRMWMEWDYAWKRWPEFRGDER